MKNSISIFAVGLLLVGQVFAQIPTRWRVNNNSNYNPSQSLYGENYGGTATYPVFSEINEAMTWQGNINGAVKDGDTLYVEGSGVIYQSSDVTKRVIIFGAGFFLNQNPGTTIGEPTQIAELHFNSGSSGSEIIGCIVGASYNGADLFIRDNNITVSRVQVLNNLNIGSNLQNVLVRQCIFMNTGQNVLGGFFNGWVAPTNFRFNNNIVRGLLDWPTTGSSIRECNNNLFDIPNGTTTNPSLNIRATEFRNNMIVNPLANISVTSPTISHNIVANNNQLLNSANRILVTNIPSLFVSGNTSTDGKYQLSANSQARNAGFGGSGNQNHIGPFGNYRPPYSLSGLGPIPVIYQISTQGSATPGAGIPVNISSRVVR